MDIGTLASSSRGRMPSADLREVEALVAELRRLGALDPCDVAEIRAMSRAPAEPVRLSYVRGPGSLALHARRTLGGPGGDGATCARLLVPAWLLDATLDAPGLVDEARRDLADLVRATFLVVEARLTEYFAFAAGNDTVLVVDEREPATLVVRAATTPSPRLRPVPPRDVPARGDGGRDVLSRASD